MTKSYKTETIGYNKESFFWTFDGDKTLDETAHEIAEAVWRELTVADAGLENGNVCLHLGDQNPDGVYMGFSVEDMARELAEEATKDGWRDVEDDLENLELTRDTLRRAADILDAALIELAKVVG